MWDDLNIKDKTKWIMFFMSQGVTSIKQMKSLFNDSSRPQSSK